jgi:hypothetical protein
VLLFLHFAYNRIAVAIEQTQDAMINTRNGAPTRKPIMGFLEFKYITISSTRFSAMVRLGSTPFKNLIH